MLRVIKSLWSSRPFQIEDNRKKIDNLNIEIKNYQTNV